MTGWVVAAILMWSTMTIYFDTRLDKLEREVKQLELRCE